MHHCTKLRELNLCLPEIEERSTLPAEAGSTGLWFHEQTDRVHVMATAEFLGSKVAFDRKRAESGDAHYKAGTLFEPRSGRKVLELAAYFDPSLTKLAIALSGVKGRRYSSWRMVLNQVQHE